MGGLASNHCHSTGSKIIRLTKGIILRMKNCSENKLKCKVLNALTEKKARDPEGSEDERGFIYTISFCYNDLHICMMIDLIIHYHPPSLSVILAVLPHDEGVFAPQQSHNKLHFH